MSQFYSTCMSVDIWLKMRRNVLSCRQKYIRLSREKEVLALFLRTMAREGKGNSWVRFVPTRDRLLLRSTTTIWCSYLEMIWVIELSESLDCAKQKSVKISNYVFAAVFHQELRLLPCHARPGQATHSSGNFLSGGSSLSRNPTTSSSGAALPCKLGKTFIYSDYVLRSAK